MKADKPWKKNFLDLLTALRWFMGCACLGFAVLLFTAPTLFGNIFITTTAVLSVVAYSCVGALVGYMIKVGKRRKDEEDLNEYYKSH